MTSSISSNRVAWSGATSTGELPGSSVDPADLATAAELPAGPEALLLVAALALTALAWWLAAPRPAALSVAAASAAAAVLWLLGPVPAGAWFFLAVAALGVVLEVRGTPGIVIAGLGAGVSVLFAGHVLHAVPQDPVVALLASGATVVAALWAGRKAGTTSSRPQSSQAAPVGAVAFVLEADGRSGQAVVAGALWPLRSASGALSVGSLVEVLAEAQGVLLVAPARTR